MATVAIDIGASRTKLAVYDRREQRPILAVCVPTVAYVPRSGSILVASAALEAIKMDPAGGIDDIKDRIGGSPYLRNRRRVLQADILRALVTELRNGVHDELPTSCTVLVPLKFDLHQSEMLQQAALDAGFVSVKCVPEPVPVVRYHEEVQPTTGDVVVVCDFGLNTRIAILRCQDAVWRPQLELSPPLDLPGCESGLSPLVSDALLRAQNKLSEKGLANPTLVLVGGCSQKDGLPGVLRQEGWSGSILVSAYSECAAVLGAVEEPVDVDDLKCPECEWFPVSKNLRACQKCGYPVRLILEARSTTDATNSRAGSASGIVTCPECKTAVARSAKVCPNCGCPERLFYQVSESEQGVAVIGTRSCPECAATISKTSSACKVCGFPFC